MLLVDWLVDSSRVLLSQKSVVLRVVDQLDEEDSDQRVANLETHCAPTEHYLNRRQQSNV